MNWKYISCSTQEGERKLMTSSTTYMIQVELDTGSVCGGDEYRKWFAEEILLIFMFHISKHCFL